MISPAFVLAVAQAMVPWTQLPPLPAMHVSVERFKSGVPSVFEFDGGARGVGVRFEPVGFRVRVWPHFGPARDFRFFAPGEKARIEVENK